MIKVVMTSTDGRKTELFSEKASLREVYDQFHMDYVGMVNGEILQQGDLGKPLREFELDSVVELTSVVAAYPAMFCDDEPEDSSPVAARKKDDKVRQIKEVITALAREGWEKLIRFLPLLLTSYGIVILMLFFFGAYVNYRLLFGAVTVLLICSNLIWFMTNEDKLKKSKNGSKRKGISQETENRTKLETQCFVKVETEDLPF